MSRHLNNARRTWTLHRPQRPAWLKTPDLGGSWQGVKQGLYLALDSTLLWSLPIAIIGAVIAGAAADHHLVTVGESWILLICWGVLSVPIAKRLDGDSLTDARHLTVSVGVPYPVVVKEPAGE